MAHVQGGHSRAWALVPTQSSKKSRLQRTASVQDANGCISADSESLSYAHMHIAHTNFMMYMIIGSSFKDVRLQKSAKSTKFGGGVGETQGCVARRLN